MQASQTEEKRQPTLLPILIILATVIVLGASGWALIEAARVAPNLVSSLVAGLLAILGIVAGRMYETRKKIEEDRRTRMSPIYERLIKQILASARQRTTQRKIVETFEEFHRFLLLWGTPKMIREFAVWSALASHDDPRVQVQATERFLLAIRADLGGKSPETGELMRIFINDYDEVMGSTSVESLPISDRASVESHRRRDAA